MSSIGVGPNGYMDSELALKWLEDFHEKTKGKNDSLRVLIIDSHASHMTLAFLDHVAELNIHVVSYPPHTTHALQGLDVVVFALLKRHWQAVRDQRERKTSLPVKKEDFLLLYTAARTATLTPAIIIEAFRKTGAYPVNREAISAEQTAPSQETAMYTTFPASLASPVKAVLAANAVPVHPKVPMEQGEALDDGKQGNTEENGTQASPFVANYPGLYTPTKRVKTMNFLL